MKNTYPSFAYRQPASFVSSKIKSRNKSFDTRNEILLRSKLHQSGLRFRENVKSLPGTPDIVFKTSRVIVFCDSDFWHGRNWCNLKHKKK